MPESYSLKAVLSAVDSSFTSGFKAAQSTVERLKSTLTSGIGFGVMMAAGQKAFDVVTSSVTDLIGEIDSSNSSWKTFTSNMQMVGKGADEIDSVKKELQSFAEATIYSSSDMATTFAQLEAVGTKNTTKLVKGFGGLAAAAESPQQAMKTLSQQATQMAAKPTVAWQDFKLMLEQTPAGIAAIARQMGMTTSELVTNVQDSTVATEAFFDAIVEVGNNDAFTKLATSYKTVGQAMDGLKETVGNKLAPSFDVLSSVGINALSKIIDKIGEVDAQGLATKVETAVDTISPAIDVLILAFDKLFSAGMNTFSKIIDKIGEVDAQGLATKVESAVDTIASNVSSFVGKIRGYWGAVKNDVVEVKDAFGDAFLAIAGSLNELNQEFGSQESIDKFSTAVGIAKDSLVAFTGFCTEHSDAIAKLISILPKLLVAYQGFKIVKTIAPGVVAFGGAILKLGTGIVGGIAGKLFGVSAAEEEVGRTSSTSSKKILASAKAFMMMGAGVLMVSGGFALLAFSAINLANAGPLAIGVMLGLVAAVAGFGAGMVAMINAIKPGPAKLNAIATAMVAMGAAVVLIAAGFAILAFASISLANAGTLAIGVMAGMVAALAGLLVVGAAIGPSLTAGVTGFIAFGAAVLIAAVGMLILSTAAINLATAGTPAIACMVGMVAAIALLAVGAAVLGPALLVGGAGFLLFGAGLVLVATAAILAGVALNIIAVALPMVVEYGTSGAVAIAALGASMIVFAAGATVAGVAAIVLGTGILVLAAGLTVAGLAAIVAAAGLIVMGAGAVVLGAGITVCAASLLLLGTALPKIASGATSGAAGLALVAAAILALGVASITTTIGIAAFGVAILVASAGTVVLGVALLAVNSSMKSISSNAKSASNSMVSMVSAIDVVNAGLDALENKAKSAIQKFVKSFKNSKGDAQSASKELADGVKKGIESGLKPIPTITTTAMSGMNSALNLGKVQSVSIAQSTASGIIAAFMSAQASAYSSGYYIGIGLANGMQSTLGTVQAVAAQLANAANAAIQTAAKIHSPSDITTDFGEYYGEGWINGIISKVAEAKKAVKQLVFIPDIPSMGELSASLNLEQSEGSKLNGEYSYNPKIYIEQPVYLDGREISKGTAKYTKEELETLERRERRKQGYK